MLTKSPRIDEIIHFTLLRRKFGSTEAIKVSPSSTIENTRSMDVSEYFKTILSRVNILGLIVENQSFVAGAILNRRGRYFLRC